MQKLLFENIIEEKIPQQKLRENKNKINGTCIKSTQLTLEQYRFELHGYTSMEIFAIDTELFLHIPGFHICVFNQLQMENIFS